MLRLQKTLTLGALLLILAPASAGAQAIVTPVFGAAIGGDTIEPPKKTLGGLVGFWGDGPIGFEVDFSYFPDFFPEGHPNGELHAVGDLVTIMGNVIVGTSVAPDAYGVRPYASGGIGMFQIRADEPSNLFEVRGNDLGYNVGGGVIAFLSDAVGVRGDLRFFQDLRDKDKDLAAESRHSGQALVRFGRFNFFRASAGVTFRF